MMEIKEIVLKATELGCLEKVLRGEGEYRKEVSEFIGSEVPTDWSNVIRGGIYKIYVENPEININNEFENALINLCKGNYYDVYCATMVTFFQIMSEERKSAPFFIKRKIVLEKLKKGLIKNKSELEKCNKWTGRRFPDGIWGDIRRVDSILFEDYGITII